MAHKKDSLIAAILAVDDCTPANGGLCVYPGSHKLGPLEDFSDVKGFHYLDPKKFPLEKATPLTLKKGQVSARSNSCAFVYFRNWEWTFALQSVILNNHLISTNKRPNAIIYCHRTV